MEKRVSFGNVGDKMVILFIFWLKVRVYLMFFFFESFVWGLHFLFFVFLF